MVRCGSVELCSNSSLAVAAQVLQDLEGRDNLTVQEVIHWWVIRQSTWLSFTSCFSMSCRKGPKLAIMRSWVTSVAVPVSSATVISSGVQLWALLACLMGTLPNCQCFYSSVQMHYSINTCSWRFHLIWPFYVRSYLSSFQLSWCGYSF